MGALRKLAEVDLINVNNLREIKEIPLFHGFSDSEMQSFLQGSEVVIHYSGECLFKRGQDSTFFGLILSGNYKLSLNCKKGDEVIMHIGAFGEMLAIMAVMGEGITYPFDAIAMGTSRFLKIPKENFYKTWLHSPQLMFRFQKELQGRIFRGHDEKRMLKFSLAKRVADLLIYLSEHKTRSENQIEIPITRREIASYVGASVESVIRVMSQWSQDGWIETLDKKIQIHNQKALKDLAEDNLNDGKTNERRSIQSFHRMKDLWARTSISLKGHKRSEEKERNWMS